MSSFFKDLGVGIGLRSAFYEQFLPRPPKSVSFVEVISENYMDWTHREIGRPMQNLEKVRQHLPVVLHGVSMSLGSSDPIDKHYLSRLKSLIDRIEPEWISDHLCWTGVAGENLHDLLPLPFTNEALDIVTQKIIQVQEFLGRRILIENVSSYVEFANADMTEWEFLAEIAQKADCGILLDVNNIFVNSINHQFDPMHYLNSVPKSRVAQIHLAGHTDKNDYLIDTHDHCVCPRVWELYHWCVDNIGHVSSMIEWDDNIPQWSVLEQELAKIHTARSQKYAPTTSSTVAASV